LASNFWNRNRPFRFQKCRPLFIGTHNEMLFVVAMRISNPDCSPFGIKGWDPAQTPDALSSPPHTARSPRPVPTTGIVSVQLRGHVIVLRDLLLNAQLFVALVLWLATDVSNAVSLVLEHGKDLTIVRRALDVIDGSAAYFLLPRRFGVGTRKPAAESSDFVLATSISAQPAKKEDSVTEARLMKDFLN
jgi:hypothetical protein